MHDIPDPFPVITQGWLWVGLLDSRFWSGKLSLVDDCIEFSRNDCGIQKTFASALRALLLFKLETGVISNLTPWLRWRTQYRSPAPPLPSPGPPRNSA